MAKSKRKPAAKPKAARPAAPRRIADLTPEQWALVAEQRECWRAIGLCTEPADRVAAEAAATWMYQRVGHEPPIFVWLDGPASICFLAPLFLGTEQLESQLRSQLRSQLESQLESQLWSQLGSQLESQLRSQLRSQLWSQLESQLGSQLWSQLEGDARTVYQYLWAGAEACYWIAWYTVARDLAGVLYDQADNEALDNWAKLYGSAGWWLPTERVCFMSERHRTVRFDDRRLLHCETGPAIECRDGYCVYAWHGTRVPAEWIEQRETLDPKTALTWENIEQRRAAAEIIGWHKVLTTLQHRVIDTDRDPQIGKLVEVDLPDSPRERFLLVECGTKRSFAIPVPPQTKTALEGNAWTYNIDPRQLLGLEVRT